MIRKIMQNTNNLDGIIKHSKDLIRNTETIIKGGAEEVITIVKNSDSKTNALGKSIAKLGQIDEKKLSETVQMLGVPVSELTGDFTNLAKDFDNPFINKILTLAEKHNIDPEYVVNVYLKNSVEEGIEKFSDKSQQIKETIIKEELKNRVKKGPFSIINYIKILFNKIKILLGLKS